MSRSSFRIIDARTGEKLASIERTAEVEIVKLAFSHDEQIVIPNSRREEEDQRLEVWIPEPGEYFEVLVVDIMYVAEPTPTDTHTIYDLSDYCIPENGAPVYLYNASGEEVAEGTIEPINDTDFGAVFLGDTSAYTLVAFKYVISGDKGFLTVPIVGVNIGIQQTEGDRVIHARLIDEGDEI
jgi:DNA polymerase elongation subunit (family B)